MSNRGVIRIHRERTWADRWRKYKVLIDGEERGTIGHGGEEVFPVIPGHHEVELRIDWCSSPVVAVDVPADGEVSMICRGGRPGRALTNAFGRTDQYIELSVAIAPSAPS